MSNFGTLHRRQCKPKGTALKHPFEFKIRYRIDFERALSGKDIDTKKLHFKLNI